MGACASIGRHVRQLRRGAGDRHDHSGRRLRARMSAASRRPDVRHPCCCRRRSRASAWPTSRSATRWSRTHEPALHPAAAIDELSEPFGNSVHQTRSGREPASRRSRRQPRRRRAAPVTPKTFRPHGAPIRPPRRSAPVRRCRAARRRRLGRDDRLSSNGARSTRSITWLHDDPAQRYDYLTDVTAVEYRDLERPIEVVWHLRSLPFRRSPRQGRCWTRASRSRCRASRTSTRAPIGWSASATTCSAYASTAIPTCAGS